MSTKILFILGIVMLVSSLGFAQCEYYWQYEGTDCGNDVCEWSQYYPENMWNCPMDCMGGKEWWYGNPMYFSCNPFCLPPMYSECQMCCNQPCWLCWAPWSHPMWVDTTPVMYYPEEWEWLAYTYPNQGPKGGYYYAWSHGWLWLENDWNDGGDWYGYMPFGYGYGYGYGYDEGDDDKPDQKTLDVSLDSSCEENVVTVTSGGDPVSNADVTVFDLGTGLPIASGTTDGDGKFTFSGYPTCSKDVRVYANKKGYSPENVHDSLISCTECEEGGCTSDDDCKDTEQCVEGECEPVPCDCGVVKNHECEEYECCSDSDCPEGQVCEDNSCKEEGEEPAPECTQDADCKDKEYCDMPAGQTGGDCKPVSGDCGYAEAHVWVNYECGDEPGCPSCPPRHVCENNVCVENELEGPQTGFVGDEAGFTATRGDEPCVNCDIEVTDPTGKKITGKTDENGNFVLPLSMKGTYKVALLKDGQVIQELSLDSMPKAPAEEPGKPTGEEEDLTPLGFLLLLLLILLGLVVYWRRRKKG